MKKQIDYDLEALKKIQIGVNKLSDTVKLTLGPGGNCVIIEKQSQHHVTKDGYTIAREIDLEDSIENIGAHIIKEAASKTVEHGGDGTTTSTVLAQSIFNEGLKNVAAGAHRMDIKKGIDLAVKDVVTEIKKLAQPVADGDLLKIATIAANGDTVIGGLINEAISKVGRQGIVSVEDTKNLDSYVTTVKGTRIEQGWLSGYFAADNVYQQWDKTDCEVMVYEGQIQSFKELLPFLEKIRSRQNGSKPLLIVAQDVSGDALATLAMNYIQGKMIVCAIASPDMNDKRNEQLKDIAALTGATIIARETGITLNTATASVLGTAGRIRVSQHSTTILEGGGGDKVAARIASIDAELENAPTEMAKVSLQYRKARLTDGIAVIYVGGSSVVEINEKKDRIDDSLQATRAALDEGVLPGGGVAYVRIKQVLDKLGDQGENDAQRLGYAIVKKAILQPFNTIIENIGGQPQVVLDKVSSGSAAYGYNAKTLQYCDLVEQGIIDPAKVTRLAIENAGSVAGMLLTTKAVISNTKPTK